MHNFTINYEKILEVDIGSLQKIFYHIKGVPQKMKDIEVISLCLTTEYMSIDSENHLFGLLPDFLRLKTGAYCYNRRKRKLFPYLENLRQLLSNYFMNLKIALLWIVCL